MSDANRESDEAPRVGLGLPRRASPAPDMRDRRFDHRTPQPYRPPCPPRSIRYPILFPVVGGGVWTTSSLIPDVNSDRRGHPTAGPPESWGLLGPGVPSV